MVLDNFDKVLLDLLLILVLTLKAVPLLPVEEGFFFEILNLFQNDQVALKLDLLGRNLLLLDVANQKHFIEGGRHSKELLLGLVVLHQVYFLAELLDLLEVF